MIEVGSVNAAAKEMRSRFSPYEDNGGTCLAVSGDNYVVVAADNRVSKGYQIATRNGMKITKLTDKCVIATAGMLADQITLHKVLKARVAMYEHEHRRKPSINALAQLLSTTLYHKRFFPYYTFNVLAGVDDEGKGAVYGYDAIGSMERLPHIATGSGGSLARSMLDNQIEKKNQLKAGPKLSKGEVMELCKDAMTSVAERDIHTGDAATICIIDAAGVAFDTLELKKD